MIDEFRLSGEQVRTKTCCRCKLVLPFEEFPKRYSRPGRKSHCKKCKLVDHLRRSYGLTQADYEEMYARQGGRCLCCEKSALPYKAKGKEKTWCRLVVDHCHVTGKVRGLLCHACNRAAGLLGDDPRLLRRMADYLEGKHGDG